MSVSLIALVIGAGLLVGILSALFGVGGGLLMVPFMVLLLDKSQHVAEGTSLLVIVPTAVAGVLAHRRNDFVSFGLAALVASGGMAGALVGASLALEIPSEDLKTIFALFLVAMGARTIVEGARAPHK